MSKKKRKTKRVPHRYPIADLRKASKDIAPKASERDANLQKLLSGKQSWINEVIRFACKNIRGFRQRLIPKPQPKTFSRLGTVYHANPKLSFRKLLRLLTAICVVYGKEISSRLNQREKCFASILSGDFANAASQLIEMESEFTSIASMELKLLLAHASDGLKGLRDTQDQLRDSLNDRFLEYLVTTIGAKVESSLSADAYIFGLEQMLDITNADDAAKPIYAEARFRTAAMFFEPSYLSQIADASRRYSIIDTYDTLKQLLFHHATSGTDKHLKETCKECVENLFEKVGDRELLGLSRLLSSKSTSEDQIAELAARLEKISHTHPPSTLLEEAKDAVRKYPHIFDFYMLYVRVTLDAGVALESPHPTNSIANEVLSVTYDVIARTQHFRSSLSRFHKLSFTLDRFAIGLRMLSAFLNTGFFTHYFDIEAITVATDAATIPEHHRSLDSTFEKRKFLKTFLDGDSSHVLAKAYLSLLSGREISDTLLQSVGNLQSRQLLITFQVKMRSDANELDVLDQSIQAQLNSTSITQLLHEARVSLALEKSLNTRACSYLARLFVDSPQRLVGINRIHLGRTHAALLPPKHELVECVEYSLMIFASQQIGVEVNDYEIFASYDEVRKACQVTLPSQLIKLPYFANNDLASHFLLHCCRTDFLKSSMYISSTVQLESERLEVLQFLQQNYEEVAGHCRSEISSLSKKATLREALEQVQASKIFVNVDLVIESLPEGAKNEFERFVRYSEIENQAYKKNLASGELSSIGLVISFQNDAFELYKRLFEQMRDAFVFSKAGGLQTYLSMRVRHGSLEAHLRGQVEQKGLITRRYEDGKYAENENWKPDNATDRDLLSSALLSFARRFDDVIETVNKVWISVDRADSEVKGMFDYHFSREELEAGYFNWRLLGNKSHDQFMRHCLNELWSKTESSLGRIRSRITGELQSSIFDAMFELENSLQQMQNLEVSREIRATIAIARTQSQLDISSLAGWFSTLQSNTLKTFDLKLLVATCVEIARKVYPRVTMSTEESLEGDLQFDGRWFNPFVDTLDILLQNAVRYSPPPEVSIGISMRIENNKLAIEITNTIDDELDIEVVRDTARSLSETVDISTLDDRVQQEGNSGYAKLWNILTTDLGSIDFEVRCSVTEDRSFVASVRLPFEKYLPKARDESTCN